MGKANPFYRFEDAPQVNSIGSGTVRVSEAIDLIYNDLLSVDWTQLDSILDAYPLINGYVADNNAYFGVDIKIKQKTIPQVVAGDHLVEFLVYDSVLSSLYPMSGINIVLSVNGSTVNGGFVGSLGLVPTTFDYSPALYGEEIEARIAIANYASTGSAIIPESYSFNSTTGLATSYLARLIDLQYDSVTGSIDRTPAYTLPRANRPVINFEPQSIQGVYIIALFQRLITAAINGSTFNDLFDIVNSANFLPPTGYTLTYYIDNTITDRGQINIFDSTGEAYCLIVRYGTRISFQRFYKSQVSSIYNLLNDYSGSVPLPYEGNTINIYNGGWYDYDQITFTDSCDFPSRETYPMPIKTGDELRFNVLRESSNTLTNPTVSIGLFDESYRFIANVGVVKEDEFVCSNCDKPTVFVRSYVDDWAGWNSLRSNINSNIFTPPTYELGIYFGFGSTSKEILSVQLPTAYLTTDAQLAAFIETLSTDDYLVSVELVATGDEGLPYYGIITVTTFALDCQVSDYQVELAYNLIVTPPSTPYTNQFVQTGGISDINYSSNKFARVTIPATQDGCYRFGLYKFGYTSEGVQAEWLLQSWLTLYKCMAILDSSGAVIWLITIKPDLPDWNSFIQWFKLNAPFGDVTLQGTDIIYTVYPYVTSSGWTLEIGDYDFTTSTFNPLATVDEQANIPSPYSEDINEVYSFSNLLSLDNSECFSSILEFWAESNSIAEGFEYYNDWFQRIRLGINGGGKKPIINESVYRQSNGVFRRPSNKQDYSIDLHTDFLDLNAQMALVDATRHPNFVFNKENLFVNGEIEVATTQDFTTQSSFEDLAQVKFSALIQAYQPKNSTCINC